MSKSVRYFALKEDITEVINYIDSEFEFKYVKNGAYDSEKDITIYNSLSEYEFIGTNLCGNHQNEFFLVLPQQKEFIADESNQNSGGYKYFVNQKNNTESITWNVNGIYNDSNIIINGHFDTIYSNDESIKIMKCIEKAFKKFFRKYKGYYIGKKAFEFKDSYRFVTMNIYEPTGYDLKFDLK